MRQKNVESFNLSPNSRSKAVITSDYHLEHPDVFTAYVKTYLVSSIGPGNDEEISKFLVNEHPSYCMTERSEALYDAELETVSIIAGY